MVHTFMLLNRKGPLPKDAFTHSTCICVGDTVSHSQHSCCASLSSTNLTALCLSTQFYLVLYAHTWNAHAEMILHTLSNCSESNVWDFRVNHLFRRNLQQRKIGNSMSRKNALMSHCLQRKLLKHRCPRRYPWEKAVDVLCTLTTSCTKMNTEEITIISVHGLHFLLLYRNDTKEHKIYLCLYHTHLAKCLLWTKN